MLKKIAFRIQGIPLDWTWNDLSTAVAGLCDRNKAEHLSIVGTLNKAAEYNVRSQVAVVQFDPKPPSFLSDVLSDETGETTECKQLQDGTVLIFDKNFWGLTTLYGPKNDDEISIDIVAVTGLDGNAYGSWSSRKANTMWLRDFLPKDLPECRVLTFGYNTKLSLDSNYRFSHFCTDLRHAVRRSRPSDEASSRPLVFFGHSYGTRLITRFLWECKLLNDPALQAILKWTRAVVFFGAVHRGMKTDDIEKYLKSNFPESTARLRIVEGLRADNETALIDLQNFINLTPRFLVISIHETSKAKALINTSVESGPETTTMQPKHGVWRRVGKLYTPVDEASAIIGLPSDMEIAIPSNSDHSNLTKFDSPTDSVYQELLYHLKAIQAQFLSTFHSLTSLLGAGVIPAAEQRASSVAAVYQQRVIQTDENYGLIAQQGEFPRMPSLLRLATSLLEEIRSTARFSVFDITLLDEADASIRMSRCLLGLLSAQRHAFPQTKHALRRIFASVLQVRQCLIAIIDLLDPFTHDLRLEEHERVPLIHEELSLFTRQVLAESTQTLKATNNELRTKLQDLQVSKSQYLSNLTTPKSEEGVVRMASVWSRYVATPQDKAEWILPECLYFPVGSDTEANRDSEGWMQSIIQLFTKAEAKTLKLRPRRFGVVDHNNRQEKVMVEFRPYPDSARANSETGGNSGVGNTEYKTRRWAVERLARTLLANNHVSQEARFPCVSLRYLADMSASSTPSFALIYSAQGIYALDEVMEDQYAPPLPQRLRLAVSFAQALAALHCVDMVHGGFMTDNLYVNLPSPPKGSESMSEAKALIAGFEVTREFGWNSDKLDVEDPDRRLYLHPKRLAAGQNKERQQPAFDIFGLGMVLIEIGLWKRLRSLPEYPGSWHDDGARQRFGRSKRKAFHGEISSESLGNFYAAIIAYCLEKGPDPLALKQVPHERTDDDEFLGPRKSLRVVELLQECSRRMSDGFQQ